MRMTEWIKNEGLSSLWFYFFLALIVLFPLPFGGNRPWASMLFATGTGLCLLGLLWQKLSTLPSATSSRAPLWRLRASMVGFSLVFIWAFLQTVSWMPAALHHPIWQVASELLNEPVKGSISLNTGLFPESFVRLLSYVACFSLALYAGRDKKRAVLFVKALAYAAGVYALYGLVVHASGADTILWYNKWAYQGFLTSTFVNKNSYAAYAGLGLLCCLAALYTHLKNIKIQDQVLARHAKGLALLASLRTRDYIAFLPLLLVLGALALTGSRAGVFSTMVGVGVFLGAMLVYKRRGSRKRMVQAGVVASLFLLFVTIGGDALVSRLEEGKVVEDTATRLAGYELGLQAIADNPWLGYGLGTFEEAFRIYRDERLPLWYHHAHNDYIEMMMDLGVPAALLLFTSIGLLVSCCLRGLWQRKRNGHFCALALGATALLATHAFVDFSLHIPAIAATFAALLGIGVAQSWTTAAREE